MIRALLRAILSCGAVFLAAWSAGCAPDHGLPLCEVGRPCPHASAERCVDGREARLYGRAGFDGRTCVATADGPCAASTVACGVFGQCAFRPADGPACGAEAGVDGDFEAANRRRCAGRGTCVAVSDEGCRDAAVCALEGRCRAEEGLCVAVDAETCAASRYCGTMGWCGRIEGPDGARCRPTEDTHCAAAESCRTLGDCGRRGASCGRCERSDGCRSDGRCALDGERCIALADRDCARSEACQREGRCRASQGQCVRGR